MRSPALRIQRFSSRALLSPASYALLLFTLLLQLRSWAPASSFAVSRAALGGNAPQLKTWKQAHEEAKELDSRLRSILIETSIKVRKLDSMFNMSAPGVGMTPKAKAQEEAKKKPKPQEEQETTAWEDFGMPKVPEWNRMFPDIEENPPFLARLETLTDTCIGLYSKDFEVPARIPRLQLTYGVGDDPAMSKDENALWKQSFELLVDTLEPLWPMAEDGLASLRAAEQRAEKRRGPTVEEFRERVFRQMCLANEYNPPEEVYEWLVTLQQEKSILQYLGLLESLTLEAEELEKEIKELEEEAEDAKEGSSRADRIQEEFSDLGSRSNSIDIKIRACCRAAQQHAASQNAQEQLGEFFKNINPFR